MGTGKQKLCRAATQRNLTPLVKCSAATRHAQTTILKKWFTLQKVKVVTMKGYKTMYKAHRKRGRAVMQTTDAAAADSNVRPRQCRAEGADMAKIMELHNCQADKMARAA